jgi:PAS domain S-box-containing protein
MVIDLGGVLNAVPGLIWTTDGDGRCDFSNDRWRDYTGIESSAALGLGWYAAVHPGDLATLTATWADIRRTGEAKEIYVRLRRFDGEHRWFTLRPALAATSEVPMDRWCWLGMDADEGPVTDGRLRRLFDMLPVQAAFLNQAGTSEFSNRQVLEYYDMTLEELAAWQTSGAIHVDDHAIVYEQLQRLMTTGELFDATIRMRHKDGSYRWLRCRCVPCRDAHGNIARYVTVQTDVHDLKHAEGLLAAEVKLLEMVALGEPLRQVFDTLSRLVEDLAQGCVCSVLTVGPDRAHLQFGGGPSLPGGCRSLLDGQLIDRDADPCSMSILDRQAVSTADLLADPRWRGSPWPARISAFGFASCTSMPIHAASGEASGVITIYRGDRMAPTAHEQDLIDRFAKIAGIAIERSAADIALRSSEQELRETLAQLSEGQRLSKTGSFTSDIRPDRQRWSDELYRIYEIDPGSPPTIEAVRDRVHPDDLSTFNAEIQRRLEGLESDFVFRIVTPQGRLKHLHAVARLTDHVAGRPIFMGAVQDVSESKLAEEALTQARTELAHVARVATLNAMTASIAHEVSQPLSGILTNANTCVRMLGADPPNLEIATETARRTIRDANRAAEVIRRLRAMFSTKAPAFEAADLNEVVREVVALSAAELRRGGAQLRTELADDLPLVNIDRVQVQQVVLNLLLNAADAMADIADRTKTLQVQTRLQDDGKVCLAVRDRGVGIGPEGADRLFDAFYTTKPQGMGVGLSISRSIIERHEGRLWAEANAGRGATFSFCLPSVPTGRDSSANA